VSPVPAGFAVGTVHVDADGDAVGFYVIGPDANGKYGIQDDGLSIATIEASGADLDNKTRKAAFEALRDEYGVEYDEDSGELALAPVSAGQIAGAALRFLAFLLRVQDLTLMSAERSASTFKDDAIKLIAQLVDGRASLVEDFVVSPELQEIPADLGIVAPDKPPVAVFFGLTESRLLEALLLQAYADKAQVKCAIVGMLETEAAVSKKMRQRALNHLDAMPIFRGDERAACLRVVRHALDVKLH
jgi:hypothetical protein